MPGAPGHRRLCRRLVRPELSGGEDRRRGHSVLRGPFHGRNGEDHQSDKAVMLPDLDAGCSLSESCPPEKLRAFLREHADKNYYVIAYINCSAGVKALSDVICTSGNAEKIVRSRAGGSKYSFCSRPESRRVGHGTDRPQDGFVAGELLRARRVHGAQHRRRFAKNIPTRRWWRIPNAPTPCACWRMKFVRPKKW